MKGKRDACICYRSNRFYRNGSHRKTTGPGAQSNRPGTQRRGGGVVVTGLLKSAREQGVVRYIGDGGNKKTPVHVDDLASLYVLALEHANAGEVFIGAEEEVVTQKQVAEAASRAAGTGGKVVSWPYEEAMKTIGFLAYILALDSVVSGAKARRVLNW